MLTHVMRPDLVYMQVSYAVDPAIASGDTSGFTTLAPGRSVDIEHDRMSSLIGWSRVSQTDQSISRSLRGV